MIQSTTANPRLTRRLRLEKRHPQSARTATAVLDRRQPPHKGMPTLPATAGNALETRLI